ncbi:DUF3800 domain-containing protein [Pseudomonas siliginis]|uniref:DUF3800 domain-containing protein n=1 Tax=Pseudomonas siliginis TaxID=2842346 RepID=UPI002093BC28|nr:DUF3800 domain-containing protein [Pseudomonas siliginis]UST88447.1 DUF3800 domain-containing protein [Pseudomonas siliginis]
MFKSPLGFTDHRYTFFYDESNNHRKFYINTEKNNYNIDNDPQRKQSAPTNFLLGGVLYKDGECKADAQELIESLNLQSTAKELKFGAVARGSFDMILKSAPLKKILKWLLESDLYIHFFNLNLEYWAFVDIIDDCTDHCFQKGELEFEGIEQFREYLDIHKDALYRVICADRDRFLGLAKEFKYPFIQGREQDFIQALYEHVVQYAVEIFRQQPRPPQDDINVFLSLAEMLSLCLDIEDMTLTLDHEEGVLVDGLGVFYQNRGSMFSGSKHIFDEESTVQDDFEKFNRSASLGSLDYQFVKSVDTPLTQVADVVAGLFAKYFEFIQRKTFAELVEIRGSLNPQQLEALELIKALIAKSDKECIHFLFYVMSMSERRKHALFMFPENNSNEI